MGPTSLPVDVPSTPGRPRWAFVVLAEGLVEKEGGGHPRQSRMQLLAWQSGEEGCPETPGSRWLNPCQRGGLWHSARWAGGQAALLDVHGWVTPRGPCCPPQVWSEQSQQQLQAWSG